ncbi:MAG: hypothetical protein D6B25_17435 [Desulfobulbaceae bacterium]|nr:MAG: hypothetical protein D6B25_17435 [Desulfobulbaceae bacterium]
MRILLTIDDTDNHTSMGSGQLAELLTKELRKEGHTSWCSDVSRHQLYNHHSIPYTSHNSSMCFAAEIAENEWDNIIRFSRRFLRKNSAPGSDPGLCITRDYDSLNKGALIKFGLKAKKAVLTKAEAHNLASETHVHLSENGGTGEGVIGALAGVGLRLHGSDGRIRGWFSFGEAGDVTDAETLRNHPSVDTIIDISGQALASSDPILLTDKRLKTVLHEHQQVLPVISNAKGGEAPWRTLSKEAIKTY